MARVRFASCGVSYSVVIITIEDMNAWNNGWWSSWAIRTSWNIRENSTSPIDVWQSVVASRMGMYAKFYIPTAHVIYKICSCMKDSSSNPRKVFCSKPLILASATPNCIGFQGLSYNFFLNYLGRAYRAPSPDLSPTRSRASPPVRVCPQFWALWSPDSGFALEFGPPRWQPGSNFAEPPFCLVARAPRYIVHRCHLPYRMTPTLYTVRHGDEEVEGATKKDGKGRNLAKPDSRAGSHRDLRAQPELRSKPEKEQEGVWGASPQKSVFRSSIFKSIFKFSNPLDLLLVMLVEMRQSWNTVQKKT